MSESSDADGVAWGPFDLEQLGPTSERICVEVLRRLQVGEVLQSGDDGLPGLLPWANPKTVVNMVYGLRWFGAVRVRHVDPLSLGRRAAQRRFWPVMAELTPLGREWAASWLAARGQAMSVMETT